jgi:hypothetical protein
MKRKSLSVLLLRLLLSCSFAVLLLGQFLEHGLIELCCVCSFYGFGLEVSPA